MTDLKQRIATLRHREDRLKSAQDGLKSLAVQRQEAIQAGEIGRAKTMDIPLETHRKDCATHSFNRKIA
jgi:hypothetical protein